VGVATGWPISAAPQVSSGGEHELIGQPRSAHPADERTPPGNENVGVAGLGLIDRQLPPRQFGISRELRKLARLLHLQQLKGGGLFLRRVWDQSLDELSA
jgi:hypothetical protein